jgi:hypothetical protein
MITTGRSIRELDSEINRIMDESMSKARAEEREACAKIAEARAEQATDGNRGMVEVVLRQLAEAIRARGQ